MVHFDTRPARRSVTCKCGAEARIVARSVRLATMDHSQQEADDDGAYAEGADE